MSKSNNPAGRPKGIIDKRNLRILDLIESHDADPALFLVNVMKGNAEALAVSKEDGTKEVPTISFQDRVQAAKEFMPYAYGKRKPIDSNGDDSDPVAAFIEALSGSK